VVKWSPARHRAIHRAVAPETLARGLVLVRPPDLPRLRSAIYLAAGSDGTLRYCGKVTREHPDALRQRFYEHLGHDPRRERTWARMLVIPLPDGLTDQEVRRREGIAAALAGYPKEGKAWQRPA
jgi:hypothetical protein